MRKLTVVVEEDLMKSVKMRAVEEGVNMADLVIRALKNELQKGGKQT